MGCFIKAMWNTQLEATMFWNVGMVEIIFLLVILMLSHSQIPLRKPTQFLAICILFKALALKPVFPQVFIAKGQTSDLGKVSVL